jgi:hypothetical protein
MFLFLLFISSSLILLFRYSFFLFLKCLLVSHLTLFRLSAFISLGSCNHCSLACFLWSNNSDHHSQKTSRTGNQTRDLWTCSQELWPLEHRCGELTEENSPSVITYAVLVDRRFHWRLGQFASTNYYDNLTEFHTPKKNATTAHIIPQYTPAAAW